MLRFWRSFLAVLVVFSLVGGTASQLARSAEHSMAVVRMPCDMMMSSSSADMHGKPMAPCKTMTVDCLKQLGCVTDTALPARLASLDVATQYSPVGYWASWLDRTGLSREPEPLPPRTT